MSRPASPDMPDMPDMPNAPAAPQALRRWQGRWHWQWARFEALGLQDLYDALQLRARVFILEQGPYLDPDGLDQASAHLLGRNAQGELLAYLRVVDPGVKYVEPSIGRVVMAASVRGQGHGPVLMNEGIRRCEEAWPGRSIRISAQAHLAPFYGRLGFAAVGPGYLEDDIPHQEMLREVARGFTA